MKHSTVRHCQTEAYKEQVKVTEYPVPLNSIPPPTLAASKNSMRVSLHHAALNEAAQRGTATRELNMAGSKSKGTSREEPFIAALLSLRASVKDEDLPLQRGE